MRGNLCSSDGRETIREWKDLGSNPIGDFHVAIELPILGYSRATLYIAQILTIPENIMNEGSPFLFPLRHSYSPVSSCETLIKLYFTFAIQD